ncbi:vacuolar iron transporter homolog 4-like [Phoenix dactylifera]|uniref:Vacuolar iron transporter n=1 Tax=Phoenix dactylifera TaxID=42345 RepID=A0A8B7BS80_PHODC|nr:vacuolar iron transporter homolog 4-like [Phoenix dactylifera]
MAPNDTNVTVDSIESPEPKGSEEPDYSRRGQWLRAAVLGASDGLVSTSSLMMGIGAVKGELKAMVLTGFAGLVAGACSMAIGEFVSVCSQLDVEVAQRKREQRIEGGGEVDGDGLPSPVQAAVASSLAFAVGAGVPLLAAGFISSHKVRLGVVAAAASVALVVFGCVGAALGRAPVGRSAVRVLVGGWMAMAATYGLVRLFGSTRL